MIPMSCGASPDTAELCTCVSVLNHRSAPAPGAVSRRRAVEAAARASQVVIRRNIDFLMPRQNSGADGGTSRPCPAVYPNFDATPDRVARAREDGTFVVLAWRA